MGTAYFFNYFLVPRYLFTRRFVLFGIYTAYMIIISLSLELVACILAMVLIVRMGINETGPLITDIYFLALVMYFFVLLKSILLLVKHYFIDRQLIHELERMQKQTEKGYFTIRAERKTVPVYFDEVVYIESLSDYVQVHLRDGRSIGSKQRISKLAGELPGQFIRIHRSFLINITHATALSKEEVQMGEKVLPVGRQFRPNLTTILEK
jgi:hypothetical protein